MALLRAHPTQSSDKGSPRVPLAQPTKGGEGSARGRIGKTGRTTALGGERPMIPPHRWRNGLRGKGSASKQREEVSVGLLATAFITRCLDATNQNIMPKGLFTCLTFEVTKRHATYLPSRRMKAYTYGARADRGSAV